MDTAPFAGRKVELNTIVSELKKKPNGRTLKKIISLYGIGGAGKTTLLRKVEEQIQKDGLELCCFNVNEDLKYESLPEFVGALAKTFFCNIPDSKCDFEREYSEVQRYQKIVGKIETVFTEEEKSQLEDIKKRAAKAAKQRGKRKFDTPSVKIGPFEINSFHYEGQELDGEAESKVWLDGYNEAKQRIIAERYKDPESQEYYKNPSPKITDTFRDCLFDSLYPKPILRGRRNLDKKPLKVLFILDTYEKLDSTVNDWLLEYLLPQFMSQQNTDVFDVRFIISGREQLRLSDHYRRWDNYRDTILEIDLHRFTKDEIKDYLRQSQAHESLVDEAYEDTDGLPYLLSIWVDTRGHGNALAYGQAANRIYWWKTEDQKEWIRAAAFKDYYDQDFLAIMLGRERGKEAFEWLKECHEVTRTSEADPNKFQLHATVRRVITKATQQQSGSLFQEHTCRARLYEDVHSRFPDVRDRSAMLKLSVFEHFNQAALEKIYPTQGFLLHNYAKEHKEWFDELSHTFKMKTEIKPALYQYSFWQDKNDISATMAEIGKVWQEKKMRLINGSRSCVKNPRKSEMRLSSWTLISRPLMKKSRCMGTRRI